LKKQGTRHDNICTDTILWCTDSFKVNHPDILPSSPDNFEKYRTGAKHFLSPEGIQAFGNRSMVNGHISDLYSLGLVLLEACTLKQESNYYMQDGSVNKPLIQTKVLEANKLYQSSFVELIIRMLSIDVNKRIKM
jgi:serine/threonine protein kinase